MTHMCVWIGAEYDDVIYVDQADVAFVFPQKIIHHALESGRSVLQAKWHEHELEEPVRTSECG